MKPLLYNESYYHFDHSDFNRRVAIYTNIVPKSVDHGVYNVLMISGEPECFRPSNQEVIKNRSLFDLILTWDTQVLQACPNAELFPYGCTFLNLPDARRVAAGSKPFGVTFICGSKKATVGHHMRHVLWDRVGEITIPNVFWASHHPYKIGKGTPQLPRQMSAKILALDKQFHVAIENVADTNYFTEKLIDCFVTNTIPIYWGCPNINKYFDVRGIIRVGSIDETIRVVNKLTESDYTSRIPYMRRNLQSAMDYVLYENRVTSAISKHL